MFSSVTPTAVPSLVEIIRLVLLMIVPLILVILPSV